MTPVQKRKEQFKLDVQNIYSLVPDRWGNYKFKHHNSFIYRLKLQAKTVRLESQVIGRWLRIETYSYNTINDSLHSHLKGSVPVK